MEKKSLNASQKMKKTPAGEIPVDWSVVTIEKICDNVKDKVNSQFSPYIEIGDIDISRKNYLIKDKSSPIGAKLAKKGDIIISTVRPDRGAISKVRHDTAVSAAFVVLRDKGISDWEYVYQVLSQKKFFTRLGLLSTGSTYPTCDSSDILDFKFGLPTLLEQRKIAEILASIDLVIDHTQTIIDQTQILKKGLMQELFTRGIPGRHKRFKKTEIGEIPAEWAVVNLGDLSIDGINNGLFKKKSQYGKGVLLVNVFDTYGSLCVNPLILDRVEATKEEINKYGLLDGDLLFVRSSLKYEGVGQCCMIKQLDEPMVYECHLMRVRPNQTQIDPLFLAYYCNSSQFRRDLFSNAKLQTMTTLSQGDIFSLLIPLPTISEQKKISSALENCDRKIVANNMLQESLKNLKSALMQVLLTGEARVGI